MGPDVRTMGRTRPDPIRSSSSHVRTLNPVRVSSPAVRTRTVRPDHGSDHGSDQIRSNLIQSRPRQLWNSLVRMTPSGRLDRFGPTLYFPKNPSSKTAPSLKNQISPSEPRVRPDQSVRLSGPVCPVVRTSTKTLARRQRRH